VRACEARCCGADKDEAERALASGAADASV
jgi:hypothetical protein